MLQTSCHHTSLCELLPYLVIGGPTQPAAARWEHDYEHAYEHTLSFIWEMYRSVGYDPSANEITGIVASSEFARLQVPQCNGVERLNFGTAE